MSADDRARAVHRLSEIATVLLLDLPSLAVALEGLRSYPGLPEGARDELAAALGIVAEMRAAMADTVDAFERLRRAL